MIPDVTKLFYQKVQIFPDCQSKIAAYQKVVTKINVLSIYKRSKITNFLSISISSKHKNCYTLRLNQQQLTLLLKKARRFLYNYTRTKPQLPYFLASLKQQSHENQREPPQCISTRKRAPTLSLNCPMLR